MEKELKEQEIKTLVSDLRDKVGREDIDSIETLKDTIFEIDRTRWLIENTPYTMSTELCILQNIRQQVHKKIMAKEEEDWKNNNTVKELKGKIEFFLNELENSRYREIVGQSYFEEHQDGITSIISGALQSINDLKVYGTKKVQYLDKIQLLRDTKEYSERLDKDFKRILGITV